MKLILGLFIVFWVQVASATGCIDGWWKEIKRSELPDTAILVGHYGDPIKNVSVWDHFAYISFRNVGTELKRLDFHSGTIDLNKVDLIELLRKLSDLGPSFWAKTTQVLSRNRYVDDCLGYPAKTLMIETIYSFEIRLDSGERQVFEARASSFLLPFLLRRVDRKASMFSILKTWAILPSIR